MVHHKASQITKILFTAFVLILVPMYWKNYGPQNFLWLSDVGLFLTLFALWFGSSLLISMAIQIFPIELAWNISYFGRLLTGYDIIGIADYMFDEKLPLFLRALSLFHVVTPIMWFWYIYTWRYDRRAMLYMTIVVWIDLTLTYLFTNPKDNINWMFNPELYHWDWMPSLLWFAILMVGFPVVIFWSMHKILTLKFPIKISK